METVKRKYRIMALLYHPDKNPAVDAQSRFQDIHSAYEYLTDYLQGEDGDNIHVEPSATPEYKDILLQFLRGISEMSGSGSINSNTIFYYIMQKITEKCEEASLELLGKLNKDLLVKTYDILYKYSIVFRISEDFVRKVQNMVEDRMKRDECIILNPTLEDLFAKNIYKLVVGDQTLLIPLWQHELVYEIGGADIYVKCIPILPDDYMIDSDNNLLIELRYMVSDLLNMENITIMVGDKSFTIPVCNIRIMRWQKIVIRGVGIPRIVGCGDALFNIDQLSDIILELHLS